ncbi:hypothetical protein [Dermatobacter hominis]|nr:hypothetical protein [Dermatobacter hominis]UDY35814.1 hypothetical protein LH044_21160 [Dermatobacter hominis]
MAETICVRCGRPIHDDGRPLVTDVDGRRCHQSCFGTVRLIRDTDRDRD